MRILHVTPYYEQAWAYGGIPRVATSLARGMARRGHQVTVCTTDAYQPDARLPLANRAACQDGVEVAVFPNLSNTLAYRLQLFLPLGLNQFLRRRAHTFDVAHLHGYHNVPGALAARHLHRARVPYLVAPGGTAPRIESRQRAKWVFDHSIGRRVLPDATRLLALTEVERRQLQELGVNPKVIRVIGNPIDLPSFAGPRGGRFRQRFRIEWDEIVLYLGKLTPRKQVDVLVHAFAQLDRPKAGLVIVGNDMGVEGRLRRLVSDLGLRDRVLFTGLLEGEARLDALADASVLALPSRDEIFGLVLIEALLCGTPVIVSDDSGAAELIGRIGGGRIVTQGEPRAFADAIRELLDAPSHWRSEVAAAASRVRERHDTDLICQQLETTYQEMLA